LYRAEKQRCTLQNCVLVAYAPYDLPYSLVSATTSLLYRLVPPISTFLRFNYTSMAFSCKANYTKDITKYSPSVSLIFVVTILIKRFKQSVKP
jgi:hypothetical protein